MLVVVISDTHAPSRWRGLPHEVVPDLERADAVLHGGDVCTPDVLDLLSGFAPVHVVAGNNDGADVVAWGASETWETKWEGVRLAMIHDAGPKQGRAGRMRRRFPEAGVVVFGHSHLPLDDREGPVHLFNPGSLTDARRHPWPSYGLLELADGDVRSRVVPLPRPVPKSQLRRREAPS